MPLALDTLTPEQRRAVTAPLESLLVLAGPGTGKTRTLVHRIAYLISDAGLTADSILAVTYTNKATEEMKTRLREMLPDDARNLTVGTFHAYCIRLLRQHHEALGLARHFAVTDEPGQIKVLRRAVPSLTDDKAAKKLLGKLSSARLAEKWAGLTTFEREHLDAYKRELARQALIDFDDILLLTDELLAANTDILETVRASIQAILVDEFQDTDTVQYRILKRLALGARPVFAVADDDQSIFAWRGANPANIRQFVGDFLGSDPDDRIVRLEANYRCSGAIVAEANRAIAPSLRLFDKVPKAVSEGGQPVAARVFPDETAEAVGIAEDIERLRAADNRDYRDMAVLYRMHAIGEGLERTFLERGIPCQVVRGISVFDTPYVRRTLALMRVVANPKDEASLQLLADECLSDPVKVRLEEFRISRGCDLRAALWDRLRADGSDRLERIQIGRLVGLIATAKALMADSTVARLSDWVRTLGVYLDHIALDDFVSAKPALTDPLAVPDIDTAARWLERLAVRKGCLVVAATDSALEWLVATLFETLLSGEPFAVQAWRKMDEREDPARPKLLLSLDRAVETQALEKTKFIAVLGISSDPADTRSGGPPRRDLSPALVPDAPASITLLAWKLAQGYLALGVKPFLPDYTVVDIETTDLDTDRNDVVEVAAVRVRNGKIDADYSTLVKPIVPISRGAQDVHKISAAMTATAPPFADIAEEFRAFLGTDTLVAHNGLGFDFPILRRRFRESGQKLDNASFDTLPFARQLYPDAKKATLEALAEKFAIDPGSSHRALDDTRTLAEVFEAMKRDDLHRQRARLGREALGIVALGMLLELDEGRAAQSALFQEGRRQWAADETAAVFDRLLAGLTARGDFRSLRMDTAWRAAEQERAEAAAASKDVQARQKFLDVLKRFDDAPVADGIRDFVDFTRLFQQQDGWKDRNAVTLMTIHAAKGLEFPCVWVAGCEQGTLPSGIALRENDPKRRTAKVDEERRLLYVAMTRARERLVLTLARRRGNYDLSPSEFLDSLETKVEPG